MGIPRQRNPRSKIFCRPGIKVLPVVSWAAKIKTDGRNGLVRWNSSFGSILPGLEDIAPSRCGTDLQPVCLPGWRKQTVPQTEHHGKTGTQPPGILRVPFVLIGSESSLNRCTVGK